MTLGGEVYDRVKAMRLKKHLDQCGVGNIALDKLVIRLSRYRFDVGEIACIRQQIQVYEPDFRVATDHPVQVIRADKTRSTCHEYRSWAKRQLFIDEFSGALSEIGSM